LQPPLPPRKRERRQVKGAAALTVLVLAVLGFASYKFVANAATPGTSPRPRTFGPARSQ